MAGKEGMKEFKVKLITVALIVILSVIYIKCSWPGTQEHATQQEEGETSEHIRE